MIFDFEFKIFAEKYSLPKVCNDILFHTQKKCYIFTYWFIIQWNNFSFPKPDLFSFLYLLESGSVDFEKTSNFHQNQILTQFSFSLSLNIFPVFINVFFFLSRLIDNVSLYTLYHRHRVVNTLNPKEEWPQWPLVRSHLLPHRHRKAAFLSTMRESARNLWLSEYKFFFSLVVQRLSHLLYFIFVYSSFLVLLFIVLLFQNQNLFLLYICDKWLWSIINILFRY